MVLTAYFVLSPATNSSCHRHPRIKVLSAPGRADLVSANLTPATGAGTTRLCRPLKRRSSCTLADRSRGSSRPAIAIARPTLSRPPHPVPNVRDDRETPLCGSGRFGYASDLVRPKRKYFRKRDWTGQITLKRFNKSGPTKRRFPRAGELDWGDAGCPIGPEEAGRCSEKVF